MAVDNSLLGPIFQFVILTAFTYLKMLFTDISSVYFPKTFLCLWRVNFFLNWSYFLNPVSYSILYSSDSGLD